MLGNRANRTFLSIGHGKIQKKNLSTGEIDLYDTLEGQFKGIRSRDARFNDGVVRVYDFIFTDGNEEFVLSLQANGGVARGIILSLANMQNPSAGRVKICTYSKGDYTNTAVYQDNVLVKWVEGKVPEIETFTRNNKTFTDDSARVAFVENLVADINGRIASGAIAPETLGDLPAGTADLLDGGVPESL